MTIWVSGQGCPKDSPKQFAICCLLVIESKSLLLKTPSAGIELGEIELDLDWKLPFWGIAIIIPGVALETANRGKQCIDLLQTCETQKAQ